MDKAATRRKRFWQRNFLEQMAGALVFIWKWFMSVGTKVPTVHALHNTHLELFSFPALPKSG